jgi:hypothetical protein
MVTAFISVNHNEIKLTAKEASELSYALSH